MKKLFNGLICLTLLFALTGCNNSGDSNSSQENLSKSKGKCEATECIKLIEPENTVEEINKIIGVDGELTDEKYNVYYWELSDDQGIQVSYYSSDTGTIEVEVDDKTVFANSKVDFSRYDEISSLLKNGTSLTYDEFVDMVGGVEGTLMEKSTSSLQYMWVNSDGGYLNASFSNSTGKCSFITGRF